MYAHTYTCIHIYIQTYVGVNIFAGLSSLDFKKREKISALVSDSILNREGGYVESTKGVSEGVKTAIAYINNCKKDIRVSKTILVLLS